MDRPDIERRASLKGGTEIALAAPNARSPHDPIAVRVPEAVRITGVSRSELYRRAARGELIMLKSGRSTLIAYSSLRAMMVSLPRAAIGATNADCKAMS